MGAWPRLLGVVALGLVLYWFGATSEVAWLFLIAIWIWALALAGLGYALWNAAGLEVSLALGEARAGPQGPRDLLSRRLWAGAPHPLLFEGDEVEVGVGLRSAGRGRGPARLAGRVGGVEISLARARVRGAEPEPSSVAVQIVRGPLGAEPWRLQAFDPLGVIALRRARAGSELALGLPRFGRLKSPARSQWMESAAPLLRAGAGTEVLALREYRPGDHLRGIHWPQSAHRGDLVMREYEPPGLRLTGVFLDLAAGSASIEQGVRIAASETFECLEEGGRVVLWGPGLAPTGGSEGTQLWPLLERLARWPDRPAKGSRPPAVDDLILVLGTEPDPRLLEFGMAAARAGGRVRAWLVGQADEIRRESGIEFRPVGLEWPL